MPIFHVTVLAEVGPSLERIMETVPLPLHGTSPLCEAPDVLGVLKPSDIPGVPNAQRIIPRLKRNPDYTKLARPRGVKPLEPLDATHWCRY